VSRNEASSPTSASDFSAGLVATEAAALEAGLVVGGVVSFFFSDEPHAIRTRTSGILRMAGTLARSARAGSG
jgi:hypothetical protein